MHNLPELCSVSCSLNFLDCSTLMIWLKNPLVTSDWSRLTGPTTVHSTLCLLMTVSTGCLNTTVYNYHHVSSIQSILCWIFMPINVYYLVTLMHSIVVTLTISSTCKKVFFSLQAQWFTTWTWQHALLHTTFSTVLRAAWMLWLAKIPIGDEENRTYSVWFLNGIGTVKKIVILLKY